MKTDRLLKTVISLALILQIHAVSFAVPAGEIIFSPGVAGESTVPDGALVIGRAVTTPTLDGRIDATEWDRAGFGGSDFTGDATQRTTIYAMYNYAVGTNPLGVSKTHEYLLDFCVDPSLARSHMVQQLLNDPPLLIVPHGTPAQQRFSVRYIPLTLKCTPSRRPDSTQC